MAAGAGTVGGELQHRCGAGTKVGVTMGLGCLESGPASQAHGPTPGGSQKPKTSGFGGWCSGNTNEFDSCLS